MVWNAWYGKLLCIVIGFSYHRRLLFLCYHVRFGNLSVCYPYVTSFWRWCRIILQVHQRFFALVTCIIDTMHLLGITFTLYLLKLSAGNARTFYTSYLEAFCRSLQKWPFMSHLPEHPHQHLYSHFHSPSPRHSSLWTGSQWALAKQQSL